MGSQSSLSPLNEEECFSLEKFQKETPRKMTLHILSNNISDGRSLVENLSEEHLDNSNVLLEANIKQKKIYFLS